MSWARLDNQCRSCGATPCFTEVCGRCFNEEGTKAKLAVMTARALRADLPTPEPKPMRYRLREGVTIVSDENRDTITGITGLTFSADSEWFDSVFELDTDLR